MRTFLLQASFFVALAGGCTGSGQVQYSAEADVAAPELVVVSPGVQVVADYDQPVFYSENFYWRFDNGIWYRSQYHTRGWVRVETVPVAVRHIDRPAAYVHYRGQARAEVRDQPVVVPRHEEAEHREIPAEHRDDKAEHRQDKAEHHEEKADHHEEKVEHHDERAEHHEDKAEHHEEKADHHEEKAEHKEEKKDKKEHQHDH